MVFPKVAWSALRQNNHVGGFRKFYYSAIVAMPGVLLQFKLVEIFVDTANVLVLHLEKSSFWFNRTTKCPCTKVDTGAELLKRVSTVDHVKFYC